MRATSPLVGGMLVKPTPKGQSEPRLTAPYLPISTPQPPVASYPPIIPPMAHLLPPIDVSPYGMGSLILIKLINSSLHTMLLHTNNGSAGNPKAHHPYWGQEGDWGQQCEMGGRGGMGELGRAEWGEDLGRAELVGVRA